ncbi:MAG: dTDP-glucose 4,6-dehydratase [archaeon]
MVRILVTGGCGFIGSNFVRHLKRMHPDDRITVLDKLTYAGNKKNIEGVSFAKGDICDKQIVSKAARGTDIIVNFAAESHVDRSIADAGPFLLTNYIGTSVLLDCAGDALFVQVSTDEVYGSIEQGSSDENSRLNPSSPYSASKAAADLLIGSFIRTHNARAIIVRCSNNYGPFQHTEKLIPLAITNALQGKRIPLYGDGRNVRDWIYVEDCCSAIDLVIHKGKAGETYNIGAGNERENIAVVRQILKLLHKDNLIEFAAERKGHDRRYSMTCNKIRSLGWAPKMPFDEGLARTASWYR